MDGYRQDAPGGSTPTTWDRVSVRGPYGGISPASGAPSVFPDLLAEASFAVGTRWIAHRASLEELGPEADIAGPDQAPDVELFRLRRERPEAFARIDDAMRERDPAYAAAIERFDRLSAERARTASAFARAGAGVLPAPPERLVQTGGGVTYGPLMQWSSSIWLAEPGLVTALRDAGVGAGVSTVDVAVVDSHGRERTSHGLLVVEGAVYAYPVGDTPLPADHGDASPLVARMHSSTGGDPTGLLVQPPAAAVLSRLVPTLTTRRSSAAFSTIPRAG